MDGDGKRGARKPVSLAGKRCDEQLVGRPPGIGRQHDDAALLQDDSDLYLPLVLEERTQPARPDPALGHDRGRLLRKPDELRMGVRATTARRTTLVDEEVHRGKPLLASG